MTSQIPAHGAETFSVSKGAEAIPTAERIAITKEDLIVPMEFNEGDVLVTLVCNVKDIRNADDGEIGTLYPEQAREFGSSIEAFMNDAYSKVPLEDRDRLDVVVLAGDTKLVTPGENGLRVDQQRSVLTGVETIDAVVRGMQANGVNPSEHLVCDGSEPIAISHLRDLRMLHQTDSPATEQFLEHMTGKYGTGREFWMAYEDDTERAVREELGVEGPKDIADRMDKVINMAADIAHLCQKTDSGKRVIVFAVGHYDNISPWAKQAFMNINPAEGFIPVEKGSGVVIRQSADGAAQTVIGGKEYRVAIED